jgi:hypothetical protein
MTYPIHPAAELMPEMLWPEQERLLEDIKANGLQQPIVLLGGRVLDGRHRQELCELPEIKPRYVRLKAADVPDPVAYVLSANLHRRHLDESQRAMIAAKVMEMRSRANLPASARGNGRARDAAGAALNVSGRSVDHARVVRERGCPELIQAVERGAVSVSRARRIAQSTPARRQMVEARYSVNRGTLRSAVLAALSHRQPRTIARVRARVRNTIANASDDEILAELRGLESRPYRGQAVQFLRRNNEDQVQLVTRGRRNPTAEELYRRMSAQLEQLDQAARTERALVNLPQLQTIARNLRDAVEATLGTIIEQAAIRSDSGPQQPPAWIMSLPPSDGLRRRLLIRRDDDDK